MITGLPLVDREPLLNPRAPLTEERATFGQDAQWVAESPEFRYFRIAVALPVTNTSDLPSLAISRTFLTLFPGRGFRPSDRRGRP